LLNDIGRWIGAGVSVALLGLCLPIAACAQSLDTVPLDPNAKILLTQSFDLAPDGATSASLFVPGRGFFSVDFSVQPSKALTMVLLTESQWSSVNAGRRLEGDPVMRLQIDGTASQEIRLERGSYHLVFLNNAEGKETSTSLLIRCSFRAF
jgi:hypothetical protein